MQQSGRARLQNVMYNKPKLFLLTFILVILVLAIPVIIPHITHPSMIYHIFLHISSLIIAIFLSTVSIIAYKRNVTVRLLFMSFGFLSLAIVELFYLLYATINIEDIIIPIVHIELPHIILFAMLALFGIGVFKVNNKL
jgi:hypothetical protein